MDNLGMDFSIGVTGTKGTCPVGEKIGEDRLINFDALSQYKKYTDLFEIDDVPEEERKQVAREVADWVLSSL